MRESIYQQQITVTHDRIIQYQYGMRKAQAIESANASAKAEAVPTAGYRQRQRYPQRISSS